MSIPTYTTSVLPLSGRLARSIPGLGIQDRPMSSHYQITCPTDLAIKLTTANFKCEVVRTMSKRGKPSWCSILHARDLASEQDGYINQVTIGCSHDGKHSLLIQPGALRVACFNQFRAPAIRLHHTGPEIKEFWQDPADLVWRIISHGRAMAEKIEGLRHIGDGHEMLNRLSIAAPRLIVAAGRFVPEYIKQAGELSFWAVLQAFTNARKPGLLRLTELALNDGWEETKQGIVPLAWEEELA